MFKSSRLIVLFTASLGAVLLVSGCSTNMFSKGVGGAAAGAAGSSLVGALTDLIIDGQVNTDRLARNMVSGAIAGGAAGAAVGHQQDSRETQAAQQQAAIAAPPPSSDEHKKLEKEIGKENVQALNDLVYYRHEPAYAATLKTTKSNHAEVAAAGYAIQALIDKDRGNAEGVSEALEAFVAASGEVDTLAEAEKGLKDLTSLLQDERKVKGIRKPK